ncbi:hypothetical protein ACNOYE_11265 [Nannocystaceae bacterium ST9]
MTSDLDRLAHERDPWSTIHALVEANDPDLLDQARVRFVAADTELRKRLVWVIERIPGPASASLLLDWLGSASEHDRDPLLRALIQREVAIASELLDRMLDSQASQAVIVAAGCSGDRRLAAKIASALDRPIVDVHAAQALGRLQARQYGPAILERLPARSGLSQAGFVVALELMADASAIPGLLAWLPAAPDAITWDVHHALARLSGHEPVLPISTTREANAAAIRAAWSGFVGGRELAPRVGEPSFVDAGELRFTIDQGLARVRIDYDPPSPGSSWPRWDKSLWIGDRAIYRAGSNCGTCEARLQLAGWPSERAAELAVEIRAALADLHALTPAWFAALRPLLAGSHTGHWIAALTESAIERIDHADAARSWWTRRHGLRVPDQPDPDAELEGDDVDWPGTAHFQARELLATTPPTWAVIMPTQPLERLDESTIASHERAILAGRRPACLLLSWVDDREIRGECPERSLLSVVLDGHHKLAAYARCGVPARAVMLCRIEDTWGPPEAREQWFVELTRNMRPSSLVGLA